MGQLLALALTAVLVWRVVLVARYRPTPSVSDERLPTVTVIVPAYNEGAQVQASLISLLCSDYPRDKLQVIAVDDGSRDDTWAWMQRAQELGARGALRRGPECVIEARGQGAKPKLYRDTTRLSDTGIGPRGCAQGRDGVHHGLPGGQLELIRCLVNRGKRHALYEGFLRATGEIVVTVDSDSEVLPNTLRNLISPLADDPRVGAVAGNVRVLNHDSGPLARMLELTFTHAFEFMRASESEVAAVMCCPGALSAYRRALIDEFREQWISQTFFGEPAAIGEDRSMTNHVLRRGYHVRFQSNAIVLTEVPTNTRQLARMFLRWARSNVRESLVMAGFAYSRFRRDALLGARINLTLSLFRTLASTLLFVPLVVTLFATPSVVPWLLVATLVSALLPAAVFASTRSLRGALWAFPYALYSLVCLAWITPWAVVTAHRSGWLTRQSPARAIETAN